MACKLSVPWATSTGNWWTGCSSIRIVRCGGCWRAATAMPRRMDTSRDRWRSSGKPCGTAWTPASGRIWPSTSRWRFGRRPEKLFRAMSHTAAMESPAPAKSGMTSRAGEKATRPLRILFVAGFGGDRRTGAGNAVSSLAEALRGRGHTVDLMMAEDIPAATRAGRLSRLLFPIVAARRIAQNERRGTHYDAVVIHEPSAMAYAIARKWNPRLPPCVVMSHGVEQRGWELGAERTRRSLKTRLVYPLTELFQANYSLRHADAVACLSSDDAEYLERRLGVPAGRIHRMSNGVDAELLRVEFQPCAQPGLLFMGSWIPRKGTREFIEAFAELRVASPSLRCTILGSGLSAEAVRGDFAPADRDAVDVFPSVSR